MASSLGLNVVCAEYMVLEGGWPGKLKTRELWPLKSVEEAWKGKSRAGFHQICLPTFLGDPWTKYVWTKLRRVSTDKVSELRLEQSPKKYFAIQAQTQ